MAKDPLVVLVANVPRSLRDEVKAAAAKKGLKLGWIFATLLREWLAVQKKEPTR
jgi:hypothetical protein